MHQIRQCQVIIIMLKHTKTVEYPTTDIYIPIAIIVSDLYIREKSRSKDFHRQSQFRAAPREEKKKISMIT